MTHRRALAVTTVSFIGLLSSFAYAQNGGRDDSPPPTYAPPPYTPPPQQYAPPQQYIPPPNYAAGPKRLPYNEGDPVPAGYHVSTHTRTGLVVAGAVVFGVFYGFTAAGAGSSDNSDTNRLFIPVFGPILYGNTLTGSSRDVGRFFLWIDAIAQAGGATMLLTGLLVPKTELIRNDVGTVNVAPLVAQGGGGLALAGTF